MQRLGRIKLDVLADPEPPAHRAGEQADAGGGADQRERLNRDRHRSRMRALVERHIDLEIFHRRVEIFFDDRR